MPTPVPYIVFLEGSQVSPTGQEVSSGTAVHLHSPDRESGSSYGALQMTLPALLVKSKAGLPSEKTASAAWAVWFTQCWTQ